MGSPTLVMIEEIQQDDPAPTVTPERLWAIAESKERKLSVDERREVLRWLDEDGRREMPDPDDPSKTIVVTIRSYSNYRLGEVFQVSEKQIRKDRALIRKMAMDALTPEQGLAFVEGFLREHNALIRRAEDGLEACVPGSQTQVMFLRLLSDLRKRHIALLQEVSVVPKELGNLNITEEIWTAEVSRDDVVSVTKTDTPKLLDGGTD
jgi:hypothetical protein